MKLLETKKDKQNRKVYAFYQKHRSIGALITAIYLAAAKKFKISQSTVSRLVAKQKAIEKQR